MRYQALPNMENETNVNDNTQNVEATEVEVTEKEESIDVAALQKKVIETEEANRKLFERAKRAEGFVKLDGRWVKATKAEDRESVVVEKPKTAQLDELGRLFLDQKGIEQQDEVELVQKIMRDTGKSVRDVYGSKYFQAELNELREAKGTQAAIPTSNGRTTNGVASTNIDVLVSKFEQRGDEALANLDFDTRSKVIERMYELKDTNKPWWQQKT